MIVFPSPPGSWSDREQQEAAERSHRGRVTPRWEPGGSATMHRPRWQSRTRRRHSRSSPAAPGPRRPPTRPSTWGASRAVGCWFSRPHQRMPPGNGATLRCGHQRQPRSANKRRAPAPKQVSRCGASRAGRTRRWAIRPDGLLTLYSLLALTFGSVAMRSVAIRAARVARSGLSGREPPARTCLVRSRRNGVPRCARGRRPGLFRSEADTPRP
jgi:hypothetical protein